MVIWLRDNEVICYKLVYFNLNRKENKSVYLKFNMKNYAKSLIQIYSAFYYAKYFFVFSIKTVWIYVTYYMKYTLGYGIFKRKQWKGRTNFELSRGVNRQGGSSRMGETI